MTRCREFIRTHQFADSLRLALAALTAFGLTAASQSGQDRVTFAVIGDFGDGSVEQATVANLVINTFRPDFIVTVGDNNYLPLSVQSYDIAVGQFYSKYIGNYAGQYGEGAPTNRFWPALGNHDWAKSVGYQPYLDYFTLPGNERYYDVTLGPVHLFFLNSDSHEPDGRDRASVQAQWLRQALAESTAPWKFVVLHHAPFSSSDNHGSNAILQWPFKQWGAHAVLAGHDHIYERLHVGGLPYFVNGFGGRSIYSLGTPLPQSQLRYIGDFGAMCVSVDATDAVFEAHSIADGMTLVDSFTLKREMIAPDLVPPAAIWKYLDDGSDQGRVWRGQAFDDSDWKSGRTQLGYGDGDESTAIRFGSDPERKHITTYFRHTFTAANIRRMNSLVLAILRDDGAVVYINGMEVFRTNVPAGEIDFRTHAPVGIGGANENIFHQTTLEPHVLTEGANVIAVELHQSSVATSDASFDLMLTPVYAPRVGAEAATKDADGVGNPGGGD